MSTAARRDPVIWACAAIGLYDVLQVVLLSLKGPLIGLNFDVLYPDFLVFHAAARAFFEGKLDIVYDLEAFTAYQNALYPDHWVTPVDFRPFLYPPLWLLLILPFGLLAAPKAYPLFAALAAAVATPQQVSRIGVWGWLAVVTSPAALWVVLAGQNTFLSLALFYGGLYTLPRQPWLAGMLLGLLAYKPQLWVLVPIALLASQQWRALAAMAVTVALLCLVSLSLFGGDFWRAFLDAAGEGASPQFAETMYQRMSSNLTSLMAAVRLIGLPPGVAGGVQLAGAALAVAAVWIAFRRPGDNDARIALLATATFLVSPYTLNYDMLLLMPAVVAFYRQGLRSGFLPLEQPIHVALWLVPGLGVLLNDRHLPLMPVAIVLFGVVAWRRFRAKVELPGAAGAR